MAYICYRPETKNGCKGCPYYKYDSENMRKACFAQEDKDEVFRNKIREAEYILNTGFDVKASFRGK